MRLIVILLLCSFTATAQVKTEKPRWHLDRNKLWTGGLVFTAGASKGFNETLTFHWKAFHKKFPNLNAQWFNPDKSWRNKYKQGNPNLGPKYFLSTSVLAFTTDQYHLNNLITKLSWASALVIKIGEGKRPLKQYLLDILYYTACNQLGFLMTYAPFSYHAK